MFEEVIESRWHFWFIEYLRDKCIIIRRCFRSHLNSGRSWLLILSASHVFWSWTIHIISRIIIWLEFFFHITESISIVWNSEREEIDLVSGVDDLVLRRYRFAKIIRWRELFRRVVRLILRRIIHIIAIIILVDIRHVEKEKYSISSENCYADSLVYLLIVDFSFSFFRWGVLAVRGGSWTLDKRAI